MRRLPRLPSLALPAALIASLLAACSAGNGVDLSPGGSGASGASGQGGGAAVGDRTRGEARYKELCASCHGPVGEGGAGKKLAGWSRGEPELVSIIDQRMPPDDPKKCAGQCAVDVAAYILASFTSQPVVCTGAPPPWPRKLRLLTRREYNATVRDLFQLGGASPGGAACQTDDGCDVKQQSCVGGACQADPCALHTFVLPAGGQKHASVHVAGSFNGWPGTLAGGGWPMSYVAAIDAYVVKHTIPDGMFTYKFVLDEKTWIADPSNPAQAPDGFGAVNSVLTQSCAGASPGGSPQGAMLVDFAKSFPVESRPKGYGFDNNADAGLVTSVHVDQYLLAGQQIAPLALPHLATLVPCVATSKDAACTTSLIRVLGRRAFRRPLTDAEVARYQTAAAQDTFDHGAEVIVRAMLSSPYFLYRFEMGTAQPDGTYRLSPHEIAAALSYTFWGTMPDQALADAADKGQLATPDQLTAQATRLLADPRAREVIGTFALQWLGVEQVASSAKSGSLFPAWNGALGDAMVEETRRFVEHAVFDGTHRFDELLTSDTSYLDGALAALYGVSGVTGEAFVAAQLPPERRAGLLGQASVLASYAHSDQTSPVRRGVFVRERLLCQQFGTPPANAGGVPDVDPKATTRERFSQHSSDPACSSCHQYIDSVGFGFERFDAVGKFRTTENDKPIDAAGDLNDLGGLGTGTHAPFASLPALATALVQSESAPACFARQYARFARGALEQDADQCAVTAIEQAFATANHDIPSLLRSVVTAPGFVVRQ
jgi:mono/diheme cytochrome c family protein